ncbi:MAG TPA: hydantoinase/oxoprolinase family protein [Gemmatimonadaceae bacterium]
MSARTIAGWDVGGVNLKFAAARDDRVVAVRSLPFEIQHAPHDLVRALRDQARAASLTTGTLHAVTMTAELSQLFRTKREGVSFVLDAVESAFPNDDIAVYTVDGTFVSAADARRDPIRAAASNWHATASIVAHTWPDATLVDIGSTSTDVIPISGGVVAACGRTDPERLATGELLYLGAVRTPVEAIVHDVPLGATTAGVSAEGFAFSGDVHFWNGDLAADDYQCATPDGRPVTRDFTRERLARIVCADRDLLDDHAIDRIAAHVAQAQVARTAAALERTRGRIAPDAPVVTAGVGAFIAELAARRIGAPRVSLAVALGADAARAAPAAAVALLRACAEP